MEYTINTSTNNAARIFYAGLGQSKLQLKNVSASASAYYHQGHTLTSAAIPTGGPAGTASAASESAAHTANSAELIAGDTVILDFNSPVTVHSGVDNVEIVVNATPLT